MHVRFYPVILVLLSIVVWSARVEPVWSQEPVDNPEVPTDSRPTDTPQEIAVGADKVEDRLITQRLTEVFQNLPELANIDIAVKAGVVRLTGHTSTKEAHEQALELAGRVDGVVSVTDEITQKREVRERLTVVQEKMVDQLNNFISYLPLLIIGFTVFLLFWFLASFMIKWDNLYEKITPHH